MVPRIAARPRTRPAHRARAALVVAAVAVAGGCGGGDDATVAPAPRATAAASAPPPAAPRPAALPALCTSRRTVELGRIRVPELDELSGLTRGRRGAAGGAGVLWGIEDSGNAPVLIAVRTADGGPPRRVTVTGAANVDWEDVAAGRDAAGAPVLHVADIGDNAEARPSVRLYRVPEPAPTDAATAPASARDLVYPDGPHDAEALLADPVRRELLLVTKGLVRGGVYVVPRDGRTLRRGPPVALGAVTAGSVSADGRIVALRSYSRLLLWRRRGDEPLRRTLARDPTCVARAAVGEELQGEALALDGRGTHAFTAPEGREPRLQRFG